MYTSNNYDKLHDGFWKLMSCLFLELIDSQAHHQFNSKYWCIYILNCIKKPIFEVEQQTALPHIGPILVCVCVGGGMGYVSIWVPT